jgi:hypothetical protein
MTMIEQLTVLYLVIHGVSRLEWSIDGAGGSRVAYLGVRAWRRNIFSPHTACT